MKHRRIMTAHLLNVQLWKQSGKDWQGMLLARIKQLLQVRRVITAEEISLNLAYNEGKRKGWKSMVKNRIV